MKKTFVKIFEYVLVFLALELICFFANRGIVIKGLFMDDLFHWSWFRGLNLFEFAFKFYGASRYRPVFETIQYAFYNIIGTEPLRYAIINKIYNGIIALFIYHFIKKLDAGRVVAGLFSVLYLFAHFAYYQIGQGIGSLESDALLFSIILLYFALKNVGIINGESESSYKFLIRNTITMFIIYLLLVFSHERFLGTAVIVILAVWFSKIGFEKEGHKYKTIFTIAFVIELLIICFIRYIAIGKVLPAGTGGTNVEETFSVIQCIKYCFIQVAFIFGINIGPEYLFGVSFFDLPDTRIKILALISICLIISVFAIYIIYRIKNITNIKYLSADLLFLFFIAVCIGASSVTIRVEMRFIYVSFTAALIYLSYMYSFIIHNTNIKTLKSVLLILLVLIFTTRLPIEIKYREYFPKIHCYVDQIRMNSLYDLTIGRFGVDEVLHNKKVYIINKYFGMTEFYAEYFYKIYDKDNIGNKIVLVNDISDISEKEIDENTIILYEDLITNKYSILQ